MTLKTYQAPTMAEALAAVKKDLGKDAVILHTRLFRKGAWMGLGGRKMVEVTASVGVNVPTMSQRREARAASEPVMSEPRGAGRAWASPGEPAQRASGPDRPSARPAALERAYGLTPAVHVAGPAPADDASRRAVSNEPAADRAAREQVARANAASASTPAFDASLRDELTAIKRMVGQVLQGTAQVFAATTTATAGGTPGMGSAPAGGACVAAPAPPMPAALLKYYLRLLEADVARELADEIAGDIRDELTPGELGDEGIVRQAVLRRLEAMIPVDNAGPVPARAADGRPTTIALVGPTGVGKTTTAAKLAASYRLRHGRKVAMITADTYRIAAVEQLRTYAQIIGVPLRVVADAGAMDAACAELADHDVLIIDTAGRSPGDRGRLDELAALLSAARPHQTHLVLASVAGEASLSRTIEAFAPACPTRVIFTKLDEAASFGVLVNVARRLDARLSFVTTGQEVPDDIEAGRADRLARLVLEGSLAP